MEREPEVYVARGQNGMPEGTYCVWKYPSGEVELMFKPLGERTFLPAVLMEREQ